MFLGVIADDFTGGTDIAGFLVENGMRTIQFSGIPNQKIDGNIDAVVISLKSRSCPVEEAIQQSVAAAKWLKSQGSKQIYFKYCSTFDSSEQGNIGPVTDALLKLLGCSSTIICPALPVNGRSVYQGYLFVNDQLLSESSMRHHPITPMTDSNLLRLIEQQSLGKAGLINQAIIDQGTEATLSALKALSEKGANYIVVDTTRETDLHTIAQATQDFDLVTGGSGLAIGIAHHFSKNHPHSIKATEKGNPKKGKTIILSGSCSEMTNKQVAQYQQIAPSLQIDIEKTDHSDYINEVMDWIDQQQNALAPLVYATADPEKLSSIQSIYGKEKSSQMIEDFFAQLTLNLRNSGYQNYIIAGGETSGKVSQTLNVTGFYIGPQIAPGIPWVKAINNDISLALKSGNFGDVHFFAKAQEYL